MFNALHLFLDRNVLGAITCLDVRFMEYRVDIFMHDLFGISVRVLCVCGCL